MVNKAVIAIAMLFTKIVTVFGVDIVDPNETKPLLQQLPSIFLSQPSEVKDMINFSLHDVEDAVALQSTCKPLYKSSLLQNLTTFAKTLRVFQNHVDTKSSFFNDDQQAEVEHLVAIRAQIQRLMNVIQKSGKIYEKDGVMPSWATLYNKVHSDYLVFETKLQDPSHPLFEKINSLKEHNLILFAQEEEFLNDVVIDLGGNVAQEKAPLLKRMIHTLGRNKKIVALGTFTLGAICVGGTYYLMQYPPFDAQSFINTYDSPQTGHAYRGYSYRGIDLTDTVVQYNGCLPGGNFLHWFGNETSFPNCYLYQDPQSYTELIDVCNKTILDVTVFLYERCGFNKDYWLSLLNPINNYSYEIRRNGLYCNLHPSNQTLVCASLSGWRQQATVADISQISLAGVEQYYNYCHGVNAGLYGGFMGTITFVFVGFMIWSWCLG